MIRPHFRQVWCVENNSAEAVTGRSAFLGRT
jgi:hypothetical protein